MATTHLPPEHAWRVKTIRGGSGTISHPVIAVAPGCPASPHATRDCACKVFRNRTHADAYIREQEAAHA